VADGTLTDNHKYTISSCQTACS